MNRNIGAAARSAGPAAAPSAYGLIQGKPFSIREILSNRGCGVSFNQSVRAGRACRGAQRVRTGSG